MSNQEKRHRSSMQHLRYLNSFMNEIDREVMSLTDRAFKSLCIGDEAVYNDSEFAPSPVTCQKPLVGEIPGNKQESAISKFKKLNSNLLNGTNAVLSKADMSSKELSLFAILVSKKNGGSTKPMNGDTCGKSAVNTVQKELFDVSVSVEDSLSPQSHLASESDPTEKSSKDTSKSPKSKQSKHIKVRKLNSINFFLHSEFSPFLSWRDLNHFSSGHEHISDIMQNNRPPEWYESAIFEELTAAREQYKINVPILEENNIVKCPTEKESCQPKPQLDLVQPAPLESDIGKEEILINILTKNPSLVTEQRCNSEKREPCVPWRKSKSRAKSAATLGQSLLNSPLCERTTAREVAVEPTKNKVHTIEDKTSTSSTPFSISQLLTPVIPSRHGTGTSEILQAVLSPTGLEVPPLTEREMLPSPEIKREGYKSIASSLLFNIKDNRKRVKSMYSPPRFRGLDHGQTKDSPQSEESKDLLGVPETSETKNISPCTKADVSPLSPLQEIADTKSSKGIPDDYLALCLLQSGNNALTNKSLRSSKSPGANKTGYPSLALYKKANPDETQVTTNDTGSQSFTEKATNKLAEPVNGSNQMFKGVVKETQSKINTMEFGLNDKQTNAILGRQTFLERPEEHPNLDLTKADNRDLCYRANKTIDKMASNIGKQRSPIRDKEINTMEVAAKHAFSAKQNNYIKNQRFVGTDDKNDSSNAGTPRLSTKNKNNEKKSIHLGHAPVTTKVQSDILSKSVPEVEQNATKESLTMKGNTSAKRAIFVSIEQVSRKTYLPLPTDTTVVNKFDLAKVALEEVIAERQHRKWKDKVDESQKTPSPCVLTDVERKRVKSRGDLEQPPKNPQLTIFKATEGRGNLEDEKGGNTVTAFKSNQQTVQTISDEATKHGESHMAEVKITRNWKQEDPVGLCQHVIKHLSNNERDTIYITDKEGNQYSGRRDEKGHDEKEVCVKYNAKKDRKETDIVGSRNVQCLGQYQEEPKGDIICSPDKPEVPPRRGRSNSQSNDRLVEKAKSNNDLRRESEMEAVESREGISIHQSQSKNQGPMKGNVSHLKKKYDKEMQLSHKDAKKSLLIGGSEKSVESVERGQNENLAKSNVTHKPMTPKVTLSHPENETCSITYRDLDLEDNGMSFDPSNQAEDEKHSCLQRQKSDNQDIQKAKEDPVQNREETIVKVSKTNEKEEGDVQLKEWGDSENKPKGPCKSYVKDFLNGLLGLTGTEKTKVSGGNDNKLDVDEKRKKDNIPEHAQVPVSRNRKQSHDSSTSSNSSQLSPLHQSKPSTVEMRQMEECNSKGNVDINIEDKNHKMKMDSYSSSNNEHQLKSQDKDFPSIDVEKKGWVQSLIESARNLSQTPTSHLLSKDQPDTSQTSQVEPQKGSDKGLKDLETSNDFIYSTLVKHPQTNEPAMHLLSPPVNQLAAGSVSASEEEERRSAVSTLSEGMDSYEACMGDSMENNPNSALTTDEVKAKATNERSGSACSGNDVHDTNRPPVVPPKTEKALRRALKLTNRRIQKAEAKSNSERSGRSSEKTTGQKPERRHHSTDKIHGDRLENMLLNSNHSEHSSDNVQEPKTKGERHRSNHGQEIHHDDGKKHPKLTTEYGNNESKSENAGNQDHTLNTTNKLENDKAGKESDRLSRRTEKAPLRKLEHRTQSLDRFSRNKHEKKHPEKTFVQNNSELPTKELKRLTPKSLPLRQNSTEKSYAPATNIVTQSFPITQRKILQDPDSGQYFLVDMPVQIKTKTFFDPETKSYVQLPVQSPETVVQQVSPLEVMNTPSLVLYHGFVPVPISSLPQKSIAKTAESLISSDGIDFESSRQQNLDRLYARKENELHPYIEPVHVVQEHTPEEEIDSVR